MNVQQSGFESQMISKFLIVSMRTDSCGGGFEFGIALLCIHKAKLELISAPSVLIKITSQIRLGLFTLISAGRYL